MLKKKNIVRLLTCVSILFLFGCQENREPIKIGFVAALTGKHSTLGISCRDGAILAVEEANKAGGINGRPVELIIKNDRQDPADAIRVDRELVSEGVAAIVGHATSSMSMAGVTIADTAGVVMMSPTTSTDELSGIDDTFFSIVPANDKMAFTLVEHVFVTKKLSKLAIIYDRKNYSFSKPWIETVNDYAATNNLETILMSFDSNNPVLLFSPIAKKLLSYNPDGIMIIGGALDTALFCQQVRKSGAKTPIFATMWALSQDLIKNGGTAVEGVDIVSMFSQTYHIEKTKLFREKYQLRFNYLPDFGGHFSYEATNVILTALRRNQNYSKLKQTILKIKEFEGTQDKIIFDRFGNSERSAFLITVKNGTFTQLK